MLHINPSEIPVPQLHGYLLGSVSPRPICFASTVDAQGQVNLAPYSFFNVFSANPPVLIFSPARRVQGNTTKHTLENVLETKEVVVNIVSYAMVQQMSLASTEYPKGVNEFVKAGFTEVASEMVKPPRVAEAPVQMECRVREVMSLGEHGGAGNLVIVEVVKLHIDENILDEEGVIDPLKIDTVARMGGNWYSRAKAGLFEVPKPLRTLGIGVDALPEEIRLSSVLTGNDLGQLANVEALPQSGKGYAADAATHREAHNYLEAGQLEAAWNVLLLK
ncbi:MAG TPA: flavin reductase family protein [Flavobacteriaceae bacterium]|nr:flavin reductase family protein [Flavobacteriaceae bacterium]HPF11523.1 flavin reductase family protein [Flavobacteriaceae bacterium]HQU21056.1 flavin reductase family protein [Flavobacteriaceae bacterium]HQU65957.1 flavin reductase family protein [Flavobacteriaceae bacterium]HRW43523.1 flavin reductase family protein [Flavobacteriaceae bacterium]